MCELQTHAHARGPAHAPRCAAAMHAAEAKRSMASPPPKEKMSAFSVAGAPIRISGAQYSQVPSLHNACSWARPRSPTQSRTFSGALMHCTFPARCPSSVRQAVGACREEQAWHGSLAWLPRPVSQVGQAVPVQNPSAAGRAAVGVVCSSILLQRVKRHKARPNQDMLLHGRRFSQWLFEQPMGIAVHAALSSKQALHHSLGKAHVAQLCCPIPGEQHVSTHSGEGVGAGEHACW